MKRKLIDYEVFHKISEESLTKAEKELVEAEEVLAKALGEEQLSLYCFDEATVTYQTLDSNFVHSNYRLEGNKVVFENIEQLIIDESSARQKSREVLRKMFDEVCKENKAGADEAFKEYITLPFVRRSLSEGQNVWVKQGSKASKPRGKQPKAVALARAAAKKEHQRLMSPTEKALAKKKREDLKKRFGSSAEIHFRFKPQTKRKMKEWHNLTENVFNYIDYQEFGPIAQQSEVAKDDKGNVVALAIPNTKSRNEGKVLSFNWKTLNTDLMILRSKMKNLAEDTNFCKAMADLRRCNATSDATKLQNVLEAIVVRWPNVLCLAQSELAGIIGEALETINQTCDDQTCEFMAEGVLRNAFTAYPERVEKIMRLSGMKVESTEDTYLDFQKVVEKFYSFLDENTKMEMQVFVDLYNALVEVHKTASEEGNKFIVGEASGLLRELKAVIEHDEEPTLELAGEAASWLQALVETNLESGTWNVSNTPHITVNGDNPQMAKNAAKGYAPSQDFSGDWGDPAPVSDGKNYKGGLADEMRKDAWGNWANDMTWPQLSNPLEKGSNAVWTMPHDKGADKDGTDDWSRWQSKDTWPNLQNPYLLPSVTPQSYKMKNDNLVVDQ